MNRELDRWSAVFADACGMPEPVGLAEQEIVRPRRAMDYTPAERQYSVSVQRRMYRLLRGDENDVLLMRQYLARRRELAFFMPASVDRADVRCQVAARIVFGVLRFLDPFSPGGPVAQEAVDGRLRETCTYPTQHPHIVVERTDVFDGGTRECLYVEWRALRLQNQRKSTLVNRAIDVGNLALEIARLVR